MQSEVVSTSDTPEKQQNKLINYYIEQAFKTNPQIQTRFRVFVQVKLLGKQYTLILDKVKHQMSIESFAREICERVGLSYQPSNMRLYMPPNHQMLDLEPIEKDDLLILGNKNDLLQFNQQYDITKNVKMDNNVQQSETNNKSGFLQQI